MPLISNSNASSEMSVFVTIFDNETKQTVCKTAWLGSKGRHGWTKMDTLRFREKHWGYSGYRSKFYSTHQSCPHSAWTWKGQVESKKWENTLGNKMNIPASFGTENEFSPKSTWQDLWIPWDCSLRPSDWARRADTDGQKWTRFDSVWSIGGI